MNKLLDKLITEKNHSLAELEWSKVRVIKLATEAAMLEQKIAEILISENSNEEAVTNLISAGSCLIDAKRFTEATKIFEQALQLTKIESVRLMIEQLKIDIKPKMKVIFRNGVPNMDKIASVMNRVNADDDTADVFNFLIGMARGRNDEA